MTGERKPPTATGLSLGPLSAAGLLLAGCSRDQPAAKIQNATGAASAGAPQRGDAKRVLNVYNWSNFIEPSVIVDFEKESGIKVHYDVYSSNEMIKIKLLAGNSSYDVVVPGGAFFEKEIKAGVYQILDKSLLSNLGSLDPGAVRDAAELRQGQVV